MNGPPRTPRTALPALLIALVVGSALAPLSAPVAATHDDDPRFETYVPEPTLVPGTTTALTVQLVNDHEEVDERVETAREVEARMGAGGTPIEVLSGPRLLGEMADGVVRDVSFRIDVPRDVPSGTYRLPIEVTYVYEGDETATTTVHAEVRVRDRARFSVVSTESDLSVGETGTLNLTVENVGSATARDASVSLESRTPAVTLGGAASDVRYVGEWAPGERRTVSYEATVADSAEPQRYALSAQVSYEDEDGNPAASGSLSTGLAPLPEQRFAVANVSSTLQVGHEGVLSGTVENRGPKPVEGAVVIFSTDNPNVRPLETEYAIGDLAPGESADFRFETLVDPSSGAGPRQLSIRVRYRDGTGDRHRSESIDLRADVAGEGSFSAADVSSTLRVGEEGSLAGALVNEGPVPIRNAVVVLEAEGRNINPLETEYAIGDLAPGERADFAFGIEVSDAADAGPRQFSVRVRYRDRADDVVRSDPIDLRVGVEPKRDAFEVSAVSASVQAGGSGTLTLRVTNAGNETLTDVSAKLFANAPLSSGDDEAFADELDPGESVELAFRVGAAPGAMEKTYPVSVDFQYDDADGDTLLSDTYRLPVSVTQPEGGGPPVAPVAVAVIALLAVVAGAYLYRRRGY